MHNWMSPGCVANSGVTIDKRIPIKYTTISPRNLTETFGKKRHTITARLDYQFRTQVDRKQNTARRTSVYRSRFFFPFRDLRNSLRCHILRKFFFESKTDAFFSPCWLARQGPHGWLCHVSQMSWSPYLLWSRANSQGC